MLTIQATSRPVETFGAWMKREWLLAAVTTGVALDWLPWILTALMPGLGVLSGTRLLVLPALALHALTRPAWVTRPHVLGVAYLLTIGVCGGLGWWIGTVSTTRWTTLIINGVVLLYFLHLRSLVSIRRVIAIVFACSLLVPLIQLLTKVGVITAGMLEALGLNLEPNGTRIFSIFDSTTVGFVPLIIPACLGGLLFVPPRRRTAGVAALAALVMVFGAGSAVVAEQRSGVLAYGLTLAVALAFYVASQRERLLRIAAIGLVGVSAFGAGYCAGGLASEAQQRFNDADALEAAKALRLGGVTTFASDLAQNPLNPVPLGHQSLLDRTGVEPHLIFSEAFYEGGPPFLVVVTVILIRFVTASVSVARSADPDARWVGHVLCAFGAGAAFDVMIQTALGLRLVPLVLGVGIAAERIVRARAKAA
jgi:hypothetical protein